jgi:hypothetical protein
MTELEKLKFELKELQALHISMWHDYGSELCAEDMMKKEAELELKILELEEDEAISSNNKS